jgi:hypothetical protein
MFKLQQQLRKLKIALGLSAILLLVSVPAVFAQEEVCFPVDTAKTMVVELEKSRIISEQVSLLQQKNDELERQIALMNEINVIQEKQIQTLKTATENYQNLIKAQGDAYEKQIKQSQPSIWSEIGKAAAFVGVGLLVGLLL